MIKINIHHLYGLLLVALGGLVSQQQYLKQLMSDRTFGMTMAVAGVGIAVFGFLKSNGNGNGDGPPSGGA